MAKIVRKANYENKKEALENKSTFSMEEIEDVLELIVNKQWPDVKFSDNECCLWSMVKQKLQITY